MDDNIMNMKEALERVQGDKELLMELLDIFTNDYRQKREKLNQLIKDNNLSEIKEVAHSLKGAAGNISAKSLYTVFTRVEEWAEENDMENIKNILGVMDHQFAHLQAHISGLK